MQSPSLFEELQAFDPRWQTRYDTLHEAAIAAGVEVLWHEWCRGKGRGTAGCLPCLARRKIAESTSLPYRMDTLGQALNITRDEEETLQ